MMTYCLGGEGEEGGKAVAEGNNQHLDNQLFDIIWLKKQTMFIIHQIEILNIVIIF